MPSTSKSTGAGLTKITDDQTSFFQALDGRAAAFQRGQSPASDAEAIAADYHALLGKARDQRPDGATGEEVKVWKNFIGMLAVRAQAADMLESAARAGDFSGLDAKIAVLNEKTRTLNNNFNHALATFRGEKPPADEVSATAAARASADNLSV